MLFGSKTWPFVTVVAIAVDQDGTVVGLASLGLMQVAGLPDIPCLFGVHVHKDARMLGIATALVETVAAECFRLYAAPPYVAAITHGGLASARKAQRRGAWLFISDRTDRRRGGTQLP
jgi:hypothetical protein